MSIVFLAGTIAFITSFIGLMPQIIKAFQTKSTQDISMLMVINFLVCSLAWMIYGGYTDSGFVFYSNVLGFFSGLILIIQKTYYDSRSN